MTDTRYAPLWVLTRNNNHAGARARVGLCAAARELGEIHRRHFACVHGLFIAARSTFLSQTRESCATIQKDCANLLANELCEAAIIYSNWLLTAKTCMPAEPSVSHTA
jgi:hypothetical protein